MKLKWLRHKAHKRFDRLWKKGYMTRSSAYRWLRFEVFNGVDPEQVHFGKFDREMCKRVIKKSDELLDGVQYKMWSERIDGKGGKW